MTLSIGLLLITVVVALVLFSLDRVPADVTALGVLLFLILSGLLPAGVAFSGFGSDVVITILALLIQMAALSRTGVTELAGTVLFRRVPSGTNQLLLVVMVAAVMVGAFMSNTAATAFFLPVVIGLARRVEISPARLLMPLAFASILASSISLIGTSTNIVVSGLMTQVGLAPLGMFELAVVGVPIAVVGVAYMLIVGRRIVPDRIPAEEFGDLQSGLYLSEVLIPQNSPLVGKTLLGSGLGRDLDLMVLRIVRDSTRYIVPLASTLLKAGDVLLVEGQRQNILRVKERSGVRIRPDVKFSLKDLQTDAIALTDVIVVPGSPLVGRTLRGLRFRNQYGLQVLAVDRHGETLTRKLSQVRLLSADVLVVQGERPRIAALERQGLFRVLSTSDELQPNRLRAPLAAAVFGGSLLLATTGLLSLPVAFLLGAVLMFVSRCITPEEAYKQVNWSVLILIASMLALGAAMEATGAAAFVAGSIVTLVGPASPAWLLTGFFVLTVLLTQPMSNQAAAAVVLPIAVQTALQLGLNPRSFAVMVALAASCSFITPLEPACLLVYGPGRYRFSDFVRVGAPLTVLIYGVCIVLVPLVWPV